MGDAFSKAFDPLPDVGPTPQITVTPKSVPGQDPFAMAFAPVDLQPTLESRIRDQFRVSPVQFELQAFDAKRKQIEDETGGRVILPEFRAGAELPVSLRVDVPHLHGGTLPQDVSIDDVNKEIAKHRTGQDDLLAEIEATGEEVAFGDRFFGTGIKQTAAGRFGFLQDKFGEDNVFPVFGANDQLRSIIIAEPGQAPKVFDSSNVNFRDIADLSGDVLEIAAEVAIDAGVRRLVPSAGRGTLRRGGTEALSAAGAQGLRQLASGAVPGQDFPGENAPLQRLSAGALPAVGAGVFRGVASGAGALSPTGITDIAARRQRIPRTTEEAFRGEGRTAAQIAREPIELVAGSRGAGGIGPKTQPVTTTIGELAEEAGVPLSRAELLQSPFLKKLEGVVASLPGGGDHTLAVAFNDRVGRLLKFTDKQIARIGKGTRSGSFDAGESIANSRTRLRAGIINERTRVAGKKFRDLDQTTGGAEALGAKNYINELTEIVRTSSGPSQVSRGIKKEAERILGEIAGNTTGDIPRMRVMSFQNHLSDWSARARGSGEFAAGVPVDVSQALAARLDRALRRDLAAAAKDPFLKGKAARELTEARSMWAQYTKLLNETDNAIFKSAFNLQKVGAQDKLVDKVLSKSFSPNQIESLVGMMSKNKGDLRKLKTAVLGEMLEQSTKGVEEKALSPATFASSFARNEKRIKALFKGDMKGFAEIKKAAVLAERIAKGRELAGGSRTGPWLFLAMAPTRPVQTAVTLLSAKRIARMLIDPDMRSLALKPPPGTVTSALRAAGAAEKVGVRLGVLAARDEYLFPLTDEPDPDDDGQARSRPQQPPGSANTAVFGGKI